MRVKICGVTNLLDAQMCEERGADAVGFVHFPGKARSLQLETISGICSTMGPLISRVLVCAPSSPEDAIALAERSGVDALQSYTLEPQQLAAVRESGLRVMRVVRPDRDLAVKFSNCVDALVFENGEPGSGTSYDYSRIPMDCCARTIIAGGLTLANLSSARSLNPYGLDVSSGVERSVGRKDPDLVSEFVRRCRE